VTVSGGDSRADSPATVVEAQGGQGDAGTPTCRPLEKWQG
jgi:hypothetical protein